MEKSLIKRYRKFLLENNPIKTNLLFCGIFCGIFYLLYYKPINIAIDLQLLKFITTLSIVLFVLYITFNFTLLYENRITYYNVNYIDSKYAIYGYKITECDVILYERHLFFWHVKKKVLKNYNELDISKIMDILDAEISKLDSIYFSKIRNVVNIKQKKRKNKKHAILIAEELKTWKRTK